MLAKMLKEFNVLDNSISPPNFPVKAGETVDIGASTATTRACLISDEKGAHLYRINANSSDIATRTPNNFPRRFTVFL
ncbi:MAG: hypothetical protein K0R09_3470, partial [Clostridiales bacterium]|nr:hypothetical protein [Clostridiales bacterium]